MKLSEHETESFHTLCAILLCWGGLALNNIFFESDALSKLLSTLRVDIHIIPR